MTQVVSKWLKFSIDSIDDDRSPDVIIECFSDLDDKNASYGVFVTSSRKNGRYDRLFAKVDAGSDSENEAAFLALANAFAKIRL